jgi:hypothetical protein
MCSEIIKNVILKSATLQVFTSILISLTVIILIILFCSITTLIRLNNIQHYTPSQLPNISQTNIPSVIIYINTPTNHSNILIIL